MLKQLSLRLVLLTFWSLCSVLVLSTAGFTEQAVQPTTEDRCMTCGMRVAPYPNWIALVTFKDGHHYFFDGPKDMFVFYFNLQDYLPEATPDDIDQLQVTEYYTLQRRAAQDVFFVAGSDVLGPMGKEMVPVSGEENLKTFMRDHGYEKVMRFDGAALNAVELQP
jgi:copper chaperone NosL